MRHDDALSRNPACIMTICEDNESVIMCQTAQRNDEILKLIFKTLKYGPYNDFILQNDILYKKHDDDLLLVVPRAMQREIKQTHDKDHFAAKKVEQIF